MILEWVPDQRPYEIVVTPSGINGRDLSFYGVAKDKFPYAIECKNQETNKVMWDWVDQANKHVGQTSDIPLVVFSKNHEEPYVVLSFDHFLKLTT